MASTLSYIEIIVKTERLLSSSELENVGSFADLNKYLFFFSLFGLKYIKRFTGLKFLYFVALFLLSCSPPTPPPPPPR